ncbi:uncharacterized protein EHS24_003924 [Apiotrichum porosum]|uniref:PRKR-interacting protein 1 n=1 Tax=Apiotrichum porosum TaxID=105984 RepID=A0A427XDQ4_9TREE|nr:uncharacterized protein EHS24_003924 [Apiotrichum porosum]RSH76985.1 hypothetical protein EHS24_003924 [Apiotrichum porosum]
MPVVGEGSQSPERFERSPSPDTRDIAAPGPSKKARLTPTDIQKYKLERLLANPDKEYKIPQNLGAPKTLRAPKELPKNVTGSSSAAGSGEFHVYKHSRRREFERVKLMEEQAQALDDQAAFQARQAARDAIADAKTSKNRARRQKRKAASRGDNQDSKSSAPSAPSATIHGQGKFAGGAGTVVFKRPGEEASDDDEEDVGPVPATEPVAEQVAAAPPPVAAAVPVAVAEVKITVVDDD